MADHLTRLENLLDKHFAERRDSIANARFVVNWDDYNFRSGYLEALRNVGKMIEDIKKPEGPAETGEIPSILEEIVNG